MTSGAVPLLHITTAAPWRMALDVGTLVTDSLLGQDGFIHLSSPEQVHLPANRLYPDRDDLLLLVIDPTRVIGEIHWEPGVPMDPESMRFPHLYGPLPVAAVTSVVPWRPSPSGFIPPTGLPHSDDFAARAHGFDPSLMQRRAAALRQLDGGFVVLDPRVAASPEHNCVWLSGERSAEEIRAICDEHLSALPHCRVVLDRPPPPDLGWDVDEERVMVLDLATYPDQVRAAGSTEVTPVTTEVMGRLWGPQWRNSLGDSATDADIRQLIDREQLAHAHLRVVGLAVLRAGEPVASAQLRIDGATAALEAVMTHPDHQGRGLATAAVADAIDRARNAGCDLMWLATAADSWPRQWYARLGFSDVGARWICTRDD